ncbi:T-complex protein 11-domain-containing protein [Nemania abortiva]|nr:T-complex protein 11-domain-containing protein [Nemania abortiva]
MIHDSGFGRFLNLDPEPYPRPNLDGEKGRKDEATLLWAILQGQLQEFAKKRDSGADTRSSLLKLLESVKEVVLTVVAHDDTEIVDEVLDVELLAQHMARGTVDLGKLAEWLRDILKQNCARMRDMTVDIACDILIQGLRTDDTRTLVDGFESLFSVLASMKQDVQNHSMRRAPSTIAEKTRPFASLIKDISASGKHKEASAHAHLRTGEIIFARPPGPAPTTLSRSQTRPARVSEWSIFRKVMGNLITALPDSGADACFISPEAAQLLGLLPRSGSERPVKLANSKVVISPGSVEVTWSFLDEKKTFDMTCWILPGCSHQIILGSGFLKKTKCLTVLRHRIRRKYVSVPKSVCVRLLGEGKQRLMGFPNDNLVAALPDTGSDAMIISREYARRLGLKIDSGPGDIVEIEFADGTTAFTDGIVRDVSWSSGGHSIQCDFLVLNNISVDVILAKDYLFDMDVFSNCREYLTEDNDIQHLDIYGIRLVRTFGDRFGAALGRLESDSFEDATSQDAFGPVMINREWARRDEIRDVIKTLNGNMRVEAEAAEERRQEQWERARVAHRQRWAHAPDPNRVSASATTRPSGPANPPAMAGPGGSAPPNQRQAPENASSRIRWPKRARVSIPLLPLQRNGSSNPPPDVD